MNKPNQASRMDHLVLPPGARRSFYVTIADGPYLRHRDDVDGRLYYQDRHLTVEGSTGRAKRATWDGALLSSRTFSGGVHYYLGEDAASDLGNGDDNDNGDDAVTTGDSSSSASSVLLPGVGLDDIDGWTLCANVTVLGMGMGNPTYIPRGSFEPLTLMRQKTMGMYVTTTDGPYIRASHGDGKVGTPQVANSDLVLYEGIGKRYPMVAGTLDARLFNGIFQYVALVIPTSAPTVDVTDLWVANVTLRAVADAYVDRDDPDGTFGEGTSLMVDGISEKVSLIQFDLGILEGQTKDAPTQVLSATLRLYSAESKAMFGGYVSVIPNGEIDEGTASWNTVPYADEIKGNYAGRFRSVWPMKFYDIDLTSSFRGSNTIPRGILVRISSDQDDGVVYRSRNNDDDGGGGASGSHPNGPRLIVDFAYDPDTNKALARSFGSDPPTPSPTVLPEWENARVPTDVTDGYFNYNPGTLFGPDNWGDVEGDEWYDRLRGLDADTRRNRCADGNEQSPRDLCYTNDECIEWHQPRPRVGMYGLRDESLYRPEPIIMHNKLRLAYPQRQSDRESPEPPGIDFAHNVYRSGIQDLVNIDIKVRSEHWLCGKQYDAEMQLFHVHKELRSIENLSILIEAGGQVEGEIGWEDNPHFQILLDFFQRKFNWDTGSCARKRRRRARTLFESRGKGDDKKTRRATTKLRARSSTFDDVSTDDHEYPSTIGSDLHQKIIDKVKSLVHRRRDAELDRWDPLEPWYMYKSIHFWGYLGSITEPPCFQDVHWRVIDVPMRISMKQYIQLKSLMFDHVDPDTCKKTSTHFEESNARPVQPWTEGSVYRCRRKDYMSDMEREISGSNHGFKEEDLWMGVDNLPYVTPEFPDAG
ncbi:hypothetical protein ACHAXA_010107 [Cyclostephanos tholiformis]|uniref:carbonic anhydrase n=1 Tax=Cyclostephanos tholiformis TaxID=382380 RepID=A0ABD3RXN2_9STRA